MKREIAVQWAEWLLSNPDVQGKRKLAPDDGHRCCLGLLCDMLEEPYHPDDAGLPGDAQMRAGMRNDVGCLGGGVLAEVTSLAALNDQGTPWSEIALIIEKHSEDL